MYREQYEGCAFWCYYWCTDVITGVLILLLVYWCYYWCNSFSLKLLYLKSDFTLTMVYLNPALNNTAPKFKLLLCFLTFSHVLNNQYHSWNYSTDLTQIVINQEKFEALFCLLQPYRRTLVQLWEPCNQNIMLVHVWSDSCIMHDYSVLYKQWQFSWHNS